MTAGPVRRLLARLGPPDAPGPDAALLARWARGRDEDAFAELVRRHGPMVRAVCRRLAPHDADDAFQAAFLVLARRAGRLSAPDRLGPWLHGVARRVAARAARRRGRERVGGPLPELATAERPADDLTAAVHEEVGRLPEAYRQAVLLCNLEGVPRRAAALRLGVPDGTLSNRLARARALLGRRLTRRGVGLGGLAAAGTGAVPAELVAATLATARTPPAAVLALAACGGARYGWAAVAGLAAVGGLLLLAPAPADPPAPPQAAPPEPAAAADPVPLPGPGSNNNYHYDMTLTPDGRHLYVFHLAADRSGLRLTAFDTATGRVARRLAGPDQVCGPVRFHPDGKTAFVLAPGWYAIHRVDVATWRPTATLDKDLGHVTQFRLSPDGRQLALCTYEGRVGRPRRPPAFSLWDATTFALQRELATDPPLTGLGAYRPDGAVLTVPYNTGRGRVPGEAGLVDLDPATGRVVRKRAIQDNPPVPAEVLAVAYSSDGRVLAAAGVVGPDPKDPQDRGGGRAWQAGPDGELWAFQASDPRGYERVAVAPDGGRVYLGGMGATQFNPPGGVPGQLGLGVRGKVSAWRTSPGADGRRVGTGYRVDWSADTESWGLETLLPLPGGRLVAVADGGGVWLFDAATGQRRGGLLAVPPRE